MRVKHRETGMTGTVLYIIGRVWIIRWDDGTTTDETDGVDEIVS